MSTNKIDINYILDKYVASFFELLGIGMLSDDNLEKEIESSDRLINVKFFYNLGSDTRDHILDVLSNREGIDTLYIIKIVTEKFNDFLRAITLSDLSDAFSDFDETVSDDNFLLIISKLNNVNDDVYEWLYFVWKYMFEQVSNFEKSISFASSLHSESSSNLDQLKSKISNANQVVDNLNIAINGDNDKGGLVSKVSEAEERIASLKDDVQSTTITILGIFASIVLAFSGAFSFSNSIMQNLSDISIYRLIGISALLGLVSFNIIYCLMLFLLRGNNAQKKKETIKHPYFPLWFTDTILVLIMVFTIFAWSNDWLSKSYDEHGTVTIPEETIQSTDEVLSTDYDEGS